MASSIAALLALVSIGETSAWADNANVYLAKTVGSATVTPTTSLSLSFGPGQSNAIPGDLITYSSTLTNSGSVVGVSGQVVIGNSGAPQATVAAYWDVVSTAAPSKGRCPDSWKPFAGQAGSDPTWAVIEKAPISTGLTLTAAGVPNPNVTFPATGDPFLGTVIATNATARWNYQAALTLTPAQTAFLLDRTKVCGVRNTFHIEVRPRNHPLQPSTYDADFSTKLLIPSRTGNLKNASIVLTPPTGAATTFNSASTPALADIPSGGSVTVTLPYRVATLAPPASGESDLDYLKRLKAADGLALTATASAQGTGSTGAVTAVATPVTTTEHVPVVTIAKSGPATVDAGTSAAYPLALNNSGSAPAGALAVVDNVPAGAGGTVTGVPVTLAPGATAAATATFPVPTSQPAGPLTDTALVSWQDANGNPYGPVSSQFTTQVHNNLFGATLTLAPTTAGPNVPGTTQTLTATLLDRSLSPIAGQAVTFNITGANAQTGSATTDANGKAVFIYTGANAGNDVAQATVSAPGITLNSNTATISWGRMLQPVATTPVQGNFFANPNNSCTFDVGPSSTPVFGQTFPDILFNPPAGAVPHNISNVNENTRPFTDLTVDVNGNYNGQIIAQGNGQQAGSASLTNFYSEFTGSFIVNQPGDLTFTILHDDGYILGIGNGATRVNGDLTNDPATTPFNGYGVIAAWNAAASGQPGTATAHFPAAGTYPYELDYSECGGGGPLFLVLQTAHFVAQTDPLSIYVGYADGLRAGGAAFPFPWQGSPNVTFIGGCTFDAGAIRFDNSGETDITLERVTVDLPAPSAGAPRFDIWGPNPLVIPAHQILILTQTGCYNFDSSDYSFAGCGANNNVQPLVNVTVAGVTKTYTDTNQILNTRGFDVACQGNESTPWQRIAGSASAINVPLPPAASLDISPFNVPGALLGQNQVLTVSAMDGAGNPVVNLPVTLQVFGPNARTLNGTTLPSGLATFNYVGAVAGTDSIQASAFIGGMHVISNLGSVTWTAPAGGGPNPQPDPNAPPPPAITAPAPADGSIVTKPVAVTATIAPPSGQTIASWRVFYQALDPGPLVTLASGTGTPPATLATFDPTVLVNDTYGITVEATASGGGIQDVTTTVTVAGNFKPGRYVTTSQDLHAPVNGFEIQVLRSYDSLDKSVGDFGVGWRVSLGNFRTAPNRALGAGGWTMYNKQCFFGLCLTGYRNSAPRYVTVTFPDQHTEIFDFTPTGGTNIFWDGAAAFTARPGTGTLSTLQAVDTALSYIGDGNLYGPNGPYDPQRFQLTTRDGRVLVLDRTLGLVSESDPNGNSLTVSAAGVVSSGGPSITFDRDTLGRITQIHEPTGELIHYAYSAAGDLQTYTDANTNQTSFTYDAAHNLTSITGPNGPIQTLGYQAGRLVSVTDGNGHTSLITNDVGNQKQTLLDPNQNLTTVYTYDDLGDVIQIDKIFGGSTQTDRYTYDATGHVLSHVDPLGQPSSAQYDVSGNLVKLTDANGNQFQYTYNNLGQLLSVIDPNQAVVQSFVYDARGNQLEWDRADQTKLLYQHNAAGLTTQVTDGAGRITRYSYDSNGHLSGVTDNGGNSVAVVSDSAGHVTQVTDGNGHITRYSYDALGDLTDMTDDGGRHWNYRYDFQSRLTLITDPLGHQRTFTYDAAGLLSRMLDRDGQTIVLTYDADGRLATRTLPNNDVTSYTRDPLGQVTAAANANANLTFAYDAAGQITLARTAGTATSNQPATTLAYTYDANGNKTALTGPDGQTRFGYDVWSQLTSVVDPALRTFTLGRDTSFRQVSLQRPNAVTDNLTYDGGDALLSISSAAASGPVANLAYTLDATGRASSLTDGAGVTGYGRDAVGQLTGVTYPSGFANDTFQYDGAGNRTAGTAGASTYDGADRLVSGPGTTYQFSNEGDFQSRTDAGGTTSFTFNANHQLLAIHYPDATVTTFRYDPFGRRIEINGGASVTRYVYDGDSIHLEYNGTNQLQASYVDGPTPDYVLEMVRGGQPYYYLRDRVGSTTALLNGSGAVVDSYRYSAFGSQTATGSVANPFTYTGREYDAKSGLYYYRARWYDPRTGRFLSEDPVPSVNLYPYAFNDPVTYNDPTGEQAFVEYRTTCAEDEEVFVYVAREKGRCYVGITNNLARRFAQHGGFGRFTNWAALNIRGLNRLGARGLEQKLIERLRDSPGVTNLINSISEDAGVYTGATGFGDGLINSLDLMSTIMQICGP